MVTLRNQKIAKIQVAKSKPLGQNNNSLTKRPRGRPRKHPLVKSPVVSPPLVQQNDENENKKPEVLINLIMESDELCDNNNSKIVLKSSLNSTVEDAEAKDSDNEVSWDNDIDHIELREAIGQQFLEYCHLISELEQENRTTTASNKLKGLHEKLHMILSKAGIH